MIMILLILEHTHIQRRENERRRKGKRERRMEGKGGGGRGVHYILHVPEWILCMVSGQAAPMGGSPVWAEAVLILCCVL